MLASAIGEPLWIRSGVYVYDNVHAKGLPVGIVLNSPLRAILLERVTVNSNKFVKAYVDGLGEKIILESDVIELK